MLFYTAQELGSSNSAYGAIVVIFLVPLVAVGVFVIVYMQMKRRRKYNVSRNEFGEKKNVKAHYGGGIQTAYMSTENMTYNSATGVSKNIPENNHAYEDLTLHERSPIELQVNSTW